MLTDNETVNTRALLGVALLAGEDSKCGTCKRLAKLYGECLARTTQSEHKLRSIPEGSPGESHQMNILGARVRLEATCARRFMLHLFQANHSPVGN